MGGAVALGAERPAARPCRVEHVEAHPAPGLGRGEEDPFAVRKPGRMLRRQALASRSSAASPVPVGSSSSAGFVEMLRCRAPIGRPERWTSASRPRAARAASRPGGASRRVVGAASLAGLAEDERRTRRWRCRARRTSRATRDPSRAVARDEREDARAQRVVRQQARPSRETSCSVRLPVTRASDAPAAAEGHGVERAVAAGLRRREPDLRRRATRRGRPPSRSRSASLWSAPAASTTSTVPPSSP